MRTDECVALIRKQLPEDLRPYLLHIHFDGCSTLVNVPPTKGIVLTGYDEEVGYESSRTMSKILLHHILSAIKRCSEDRANVETKPDEFAENLADEIIMMHESLGVPVDPVEGREPSAALADGVTLAGLAQHLCMVCAPTKEVRRNSSQILRAASPSLSHLTCPFSD